MLHWSAETDHAIEERVAAILADVRARGDAAVLEYTRALRRRAGRVGRRARDLAPASCTPRSPRSRRRSARRSKPPRRASAAIHERQLEACGRSWSYRDADGTLLGQKVTPLDRVGIYVPGGKAAYPSSVLMNAIPAQVAGVGEIVMVVPTPER